jgi:hypothetical protein
MELHRAAAKRMLNHSVTCRNSRTFLICLLVYSFQFSIHAIDKRNGQCLNYISNRRQRWVLTHRSSDIFPII